MRSLYNYDVKVGISLIVSTFCCLQVHEKSVLLMLAPAAFLLQLDQPFFGWVQVLGCFTMFPLLVKDKLRLPYVVCIVGYTAIVAMVPPPATGVRRPFARAISAAGKIIEQLGQWQPRRGWVNYGCLWLDLIFGEVATLVLIGLSCIGEYARVRQYF